MAPGCRVLLHGDRGVGKSSLANVIAQTFPGNHKSKIFINRCSQDDTFELVLLEPVRESGSDLYLKEIITATGKKIKAIASMIGMEVGIDHVKTFDVKRQGTPSSIASAIAELDGLLVIDEADSIQDKVER